MGIHLWKSGLVYRSDQRSEVRGQMSFTRFLSDVSVKPGSGLASPTITVGYYGVFWECQEILWTNIVQRSKPKTGEREKLG